MSPIKNGCIALLLFGLASAIATASPPISQDAPGLRALTEDEELNSLHQCGDELMSKRLSSGELRIFETFQGFRQYLKSQLKPWMFDAVVRASESTLRQYSRYGSSARFPVEEAQKKFYAALKLELLNHHQLSLTQGDYCEWELQAAMEALRNDKVYRTYGPTFKQFFLHYGIPLEWRNESRHFPFIMFVGGDFAARKTGVCETYEQSGEDGMVRIELCN